MMLPRYFYYPALFFNWWDERPRLRKALLYITIVILGFSAFWLPAQGATQTTINAASKKVVAQGAHTEIVLGSNENPVPAEVWTYRPTTCGDGVSMSVMTIKIDPLMRPMLSVGTSEGGALVVFGDMNSDGKVDKISDPNMSQTAAQSFFDSIVACIATQK